MESLTVEPFHGTTISCFASTINIWWDREHVFGGRTDHAVYGSWERHVATTKGSGWLSADDDPSWPVYV